MLPMFRHLQRVLAFKRYLPGVAAPPAGLCGDAQSLAARLLGHKGELSHGTASETMKCAAHGNAHHSSPGNQQEEESAMHAGDDKGQKSIILVFISISQLLKWPVYLEYISPWK